MAVKFSTGLRDNMLDTGSFKSQMDGFVIKVYQGTAPATADASIGAATLLATISNNSAGTGINWDATASGGIIVKAPAEVWSGEVVATGTAQFFRAVKLADDGTESTTALRFQGTVAVAGADLNFSSTAWTLGATQTVDNYAVALPTL